MPKKFVRITHTPSGMKLAEGPIGWGITPFEGNFYIRRKYLLTDGFKPNLVPGFCSYKFLYVWMDLEVDKKKVTRNLGWLYWLPNPLLPFIWYRIGLPMSHPELQSEEFFPDQESTALVPGRESSLGSTRWGSVSSKEVTK